MGGQSYSERDVIASFRGDKVLVKSSDHVPSMCQIHKNNSMHVGRELEGKQLS